MVTTTHTPQYRLENYEIESILENFVDNVWTDRFLIDREFTCVQFRDTDTGDYHTLHYRALNTALNGLIKAEYLPDWFLNELRYDDVQGDAQVADLLIQWAAFGEVRH